MESRATVQTPHACWCGNRALARFSEEYARCAVCETLVTVQQPADAASLYGEEFWSSYQTEQLGHPDITQRARADLPERCVHWLRCLLQYRLPPAAVLELGSAHGAFVALMRMAGFDARGLEVSPAIVEYSQRTFGIPVLCGCIEEQEIEAGSLDVIVLMDVLEHLPSPVSTMRRCLELLSPHGLMFVQTPCYAEGASLEQMVERQDPFLRMLSPEQHLYLFSRRSIVRLFSELGAAHCSFEPPMFPQHDMFLVASRAPLVWTDEKDRLPAMLATPQARFATALMDAAELLEQCKKRPSNAPVGAHPSAIEVMAARVRAVVARVLGRRN